jgi:hypothetical protein
MTGKGNAGEGGNLAGGNTKSHLRVVHSRADAEGKNPVPEGVDKTLAYKAALFSPGLTETARRVLGVLIDVTNRTTGQCNPSVAVIERMLPDVAARSIMRATAELAAPNSSSGRGHLIEKIRTRGSSHFRVNWAELRRLVRAFDERANGVQSGASKGVETCQNWHVTPATDGISDLPRMADGTHVIEPIKFNPLSPPTPSPGSASVLDGERKSGNEEGFNKLYEAWPHSPTEPAWWKALRVWRRLQPNEQAQAIASVHEWLAAAAAVGRTEVWLLTYLSERKWQRLAEVSDDDQDATSDGLDLDPLGEWADILPPYAALGRG